MSTDSVSPTSGSSSASSVSASAAPVGAPAAPKAPGAVDSTTQISSVEDLRKKAPEVYQKMLEGIGMNICKEMREHQDRMKKIRRDNERMA